MANRTVKDAKSVRGTNPQYLIEKIIRTRIYDCKYWKEECFALSAELLVDKAMELRYVGGVHGGNIQATPFICLVLKMLQIQPEKDIIVEFIKNEEFKYVRALGAFYMRLVGSSIDCYKYLEKLLDDSRKLRRQKRDGSFDCIHMDEYIDELLREERVMDVVLPRIQKRYVLEENNELEAKVPLNEDIEDIIDSSEDEEETKDDHKLSKAVPLLESSHRHRSRSPVDRRLREHKEKERDRRDRDREYDNDRHRDRERDRDHDRERDRHHRHKERARDRDRENDRDKRHRDYHRY